MKHIISVDEGLCVGCSQCIKDCPQNNIVLDDNKKARLYEVWTLYGNMSTICY